MGVLVFVLVRDCIFEISHQKQDKKHTQNPLKKKSNNTQYNEHRSHALLHGRRRRRLLEQLGHRPSRRRDRSRGRRWKKEDEGGVRGGRRKRIGGKTANDMREKGRLSPFKRRRRERVGGHRGRVGRQRRGSARVAGTRGGAI